MTGHVGEIWACAVSQDGRFIISASADKTLKIWEVATATEQAIQTGRHNIGVTSCAMSPDGSFIVSVGIVIMKIWDSATGAERITLTPAGVDGTVRDHGDRVCHAGRLSWERLGD